MRNQYVMCFKKHNVFLRASLGGHMGRVTVSIQGLLYRLFAGVFHQYLPNEIGLNRSEYVTHTHTHTHTYTHTHTHIYISYIYVYLYLYIYIYTHMYIVSLPGRQVYNLYILHTTFTSIVTSYWSILSYKQSIFNR